jgi:uncharacterized membrane protein YuzA (DUF378 family)
MDAFGMVAIIVLGIIGLAAIWAIVRSGDRP